jgi:hypothetical protein
LTPTPSRADNSDGGGPVLQLLASGLQLWLRQQCEVAGHLELQLHGSALNLLRGRLEGVSLQARRVTYDALDIELVALRSGPIQVQMGNLLRGQPLQLHHAFEIQGRLHFSPEGLNRSFSSPRWRGLGDWLAEQLLGITPLRDLRVEGNRVVLSAQGVGSADRAELHASLAASAEGLAIASADGGHALLTLPMDETIALETACVEAGMVMLQGTARVRP